MSLDCILVMLALYMLIRMLVSLMATLLRPRTVPDRLHAQCDDPGHALPRPEGLQCSIAAAESTVQQPATTSGSGWPHTRGPVRERVTTTPKSTSPRASSTPSRTTRTVAVQAMTTYSGLRGVSTPRYQLITGYVEVSAQSL